MTPEQVTLVKESWREIVPISDQAAELFYGRLFELDPELETLFTGDMKRQGKMLMSMINTAVSSLDRLETIVPAVQALGQRHVNYGVEDRHYDTVGEALLWTLSQGLGSGFTDEVCKAWTLTYTTLSSAMIEASRKVPAGVD